ncbi:MAG: ATP-dependent Clp protease adaptor ClpS [Candidatus Kapaibacteriales bacterium]
MLFADKGMYNPKFIMAATEQPDTQEELEIDEEESVGIDLPAKVIVFNDDWHSFDEVINQIIKATGCPQPKAEVLTWEIHSKGKAIVFDGDMSKCVKVSEILEEIDLSTEIQF